MLGGFPLERVLLGVPISRGRGGGGERFLSFKDQGGGGEGEGMGVLLLPLLFREHSGHGSVPFENLSRGPVIN